MKLTVAVCLSALFSWACAAPALAGSTDCVGVALQDAPALENPQSFVKQGETDADITLYRVNEKTGEDYFCGRGPYCYQAHAIVGGDRVEAIHLTNCRVGDPLPFSDPEAHDTYYAVRLVSSIDPKEEKRDREIEQRLDEMKLCTSCMKNAKQYYLRQPASRCSHLVGKALQGDKGAIKTLYEDFPDYCWLPDSQSPSANANAGPSGFNFAGRYEAGANGYSQTLTITRRPDGRFDVEAFVATDGCSGAFDGAVGAAEGDTVRATVKDEDGKACVVTLRRTKTGVRLDEADCSVFHGASCEFDGNYRKQRR